LAQDPLSQVTIAFVGSKGDISPDDALRVHGTGVGFCTPLKLLPPRGDVGFNRL